VSSQGYLVRVPRISLDEALSNVKDAIKTYLEMITEEEQGQLYEVEVNA
jgi:predicted RNase H-like HicB family nuclease